MRPKTLDFREKQISYKANPGPGAYDEYNLDPKSGRFTLSKFTDMKLAKINPRTPRFENIKYTPGPSSYIQRSTLGSEGKYILSNNKGTGSQAFGQTARSNFTD